MFSEDTLLQGLTIPEVPVVSADATQVDDHLLFSDCVRVDARTSRRVRVTSSREVASHHLQAQEEKACGNHQHQGLTSATCPSHSCR